jgi:hypothetical protein
VIGAQSNAAPTASANDALSLPLRRAAKTTAASAVTAIAYPAPLAKGLEIPKLEKKANGV